MSELMIVSMGDDYVWAYLRYQAETVLKFAKNCRYVVFDLGLTSDHKKELEQFCLVVPFESVEYDRYVASCETTDLCPPQMGRNAHRRRLPKRIDITRASLHKPWMLAQCCTIGFERLLYLDADAFLLQPLDDVFESDFNIGVTLRGVQKSRIVVEKDPDYWRFSLLNAGVQFFKDSDKCYVFLREFIDEYIKKAPYLSDQGNLNRIISKAVGLNWTSKGLFPLYLHGIRIDVLLLSCQRYNFFIKQGTPRQIVDDNLVFDNALIGHAKGGSKKNNGYVDFEAYKDSLFTDPFKKVEKPKVAHIKKRRTTVIVKKQTTTVLPPVVTKEVVVASLPSTVSTIPTLVPDTIRTSAVILLPPTGDIYDDVAKTVDVKREERPPEVCVVEEKPKTPDFSITVCCFLWGQWCKMLGEEYIRNFVSSVKRNISDTLDIRYVCFTDRHLKGIPEDVEVIQIPQKVLKWKWNLVKFFLYSPINDLRGRVFCFDLDTVITGELNDIFKYSGRFCVSNGAYHPERLGGSLISFSADDRDVCDFLWKKVHDNHVAYAKTLKGSERGVFNLLLHGFDWVDTWQKVLPGQVLSYKVDCKAALPGNARVVRFHGKPRPHEVLDVSWVKKCWTI